MKYIYSFIGRFLMGMMVGSLVYMITGVYTDALTLKFKVLYLGASGLVGLLSYIFEIERIGIVWEWLIHGTLTFLIVIGLNFSLDSHFPLFEYPLIITFTAEFIVIYVVICTISAMMFHRSSKEINEDIKKRKANMKNKSSY